MTEQTSLFDAMYAGSAPFERSSATSEAAAQALGDSRRATLRRLIHQQLQRTGGATDDELQVALNMAGNTERPRRRELEQAGLVADSGRRRQTRSGRAAVVWVAVAAAEGQAA